VNNIHLNKILGEDGLLAKQLAYYHPRPQQLEMAGAIDDAIENQKTLVAEAATGTGKTFAYLIPALLSGKKVLISTATKTLQDQLVQHDIPKILSILGIARTIVNLKGRDNYLCRHHIEQVSQQHQKNSPEYVQEIVKIYEQLPHLQIGEKSEILNVAQDAPLWFGLTAHAEHCIASQCPVQSDCFMYKIRQKAMAADCVVVNHHLFFADSRLKKEGFGALLPSFEVFIFDEAHQLPETALQFYSQSFSTAQMLRVLNELDSTTFLDSSLHLQLKKQIHHLESLVENFLDAYQAKPQTLEIQTAITQEILPLNTWHDEWLGLMQILKDMPTAPELRWQERFSLVLESMQKCLQIDKTGVGWLQALKKHAKLQWSPFDVSKQVKELLQSLQASLVFTSATLRTGESFDWFLSAMGLDDAHTASWQSPYDWKSQSMLYIPHGIPDVYDEQYNQIFIEKIWPIIQCLGGKTFILFTSHRALEWAAEFLSRSAYNFPILVQGSQDKTSLLNTFKQHGQAILLGTGSFWEGVDVQGQALSCVAIDRLPFANMTEPLMAGKMRYMKQLGREPFDTIQLPQAIIALKQGVGRLIRTEKDCGVLIIGDPRLVARNYGADIKKSLPPMPWTRSLDKVLSFIKERVLELVE